MSDGSGTNRAAYEAAVAAAEAKAEHSRQWFRSRVKEAQVRGCCALNQQYRHQGPSADRVLVCMQGKAIERLESEHAAKLAAANRETTSLRQRVMELEAALSSAKTDSTITAAQSAIGGHADSALRNVRRLLVSNSAVEARVCLTQLAWRLRRRWTRFVKLC